MDLCSRLLRRAAALLCSAVFALSLARPALASEASLSAPPALSENTIASALRPPLTNTGDAKSATVMIYMIGSDLESRRGLATDDLNEMLAADLGEHVNLVVQTMGTKQWCSPVVRSDTTMRFSIQNGGLHLLDDTLGQLDSTNPQTLTDFIRFCSEEYPADRNILILWDHGAGPIYGYGCDEHQGKTASLKLDELQTALNDSGVTFDLLGMDACLMGSLETCCALWPYADYLAASEDFESCDGWEYTRWLSALGNNPAVPTSELGQIITEDFTQASDKAGEDGILAVVDLAYTPLLSAVWADFAYSHDSSLTSANYSWRATPTSRSTSLSARLFDADSYYVTDVMAAATTVDPEGSSALSSALSSAIAACSATEGNRHMTGLSVTLPYGDSTFYQKMKSVLLGCRFDETYLEWLGTFADALDIGENYYDHWEDWDAEWGGWEDFQQKQSDETQWEEWLSDEDTALNGMIDCQEETEGSEDRLWKWDADARLYYAQLPNGDLSYQSPASSDWYYYARSDGSWWVWRMRTLTWEPCENPGYPTEFPSH